MPSSTRIKICGIRDAESARAAADAGAHAIGLVFVDASPRCVTIDQARAVVDALPPFVEPVGLFVDAAPDLIRDTARSLGLRTVQLHGRETPEQAATLAPLSVIKAIPFRAETFGQDIASWIPDTNNLAAILVDAPPAPDNSLPGGTGRPADWAALASQLDALGRDTLPPIILAGGLTPASATEAIAAVRPYAVDVSSGVESAQGVKSPAMIADFCRAVRSAV